MILEFVIVHAPASETPIREILVERLSQVLADNLNVFDDEAVERMVRVSFERRHEAAGAEIGADNQPVVTGFTVELPDETASAQTVINDFCDELRAAPVGHLVKFEDPLLRKELALRAEETFALEMKLRRVISVIYLHAYRNGDPYDLLRDETVQPMAKEPPKLEQMQAASENQFFHLTFSNYVGLNQRPEVKQATRLVELIQSRESYEALRTELERAPVEDEDDAVFLAGLCARMNAIEAMRNCVAHNRRPSKRVTEDYLNTLPQLQDDLDRFLGRWAATWEDEGF